MNLVGAEGNMFANLFDKIPSRRAGKLEDIAGTVLYLCSQAGVRIYPYADPVEADIFCRLTSMAIVSVWTAGGYSWPTDRNDAPTHDASRLERRSSTRN